MKKLIALLLALVCVLSLCAGCAGGAGGESGGKKKGGTITIGLPTNALVLDYETNALTQWLEEETGYDLQFHTFTGGSEATTQISTMAIGGEKMPDIIYGIPMNEGTIRKYGKDGYFQDLTKYFQDREASKTFWTRVEENYSEAEIEDIKRKLVDSDTGKIYYVPTMETALVDYIDYQMWINKTWLDKLGLPMPTDIDSLYNTLVAFKNGDPNGNGSADEVPLFGSEATTMGGDVINWVMNMFLYFNDRRIFNVDENGQVYAPFTTEEYREGLKFMNKLYSEKLVNQTIFSTANDAMAPMITPANGTAMVGVFAGHLTLHATVGSKVLEQYVSLPQWGNIVINDANYMRNIFITQDCKDVDAAFDLIMTMWSEEASYRFRYGQEGVNWVKAEEGATSAYGLPAKIKILNDPLGQQNTCLWSGACGGLNVYAEGEAAIYDGELDPWLGMRSQMAAESYANAIATAEKNNPKNICPVLVYTTEESELVGAQINACNDYFRRSRTDFIKGVMDPNNDADWNKYLSELEKLGLKDWVSVAQNAYERNVNI